MAEGATDINPDPGYCWTTDTDMTSDRSLGPDDTMPPCGSAGHPDRHDSGDSKVLRNQHGHRLWPSLGAPVWPLVSPWVTDINTVIGCGRTKDLDMVSSSSPGSDVTMAQSNSPETWHQHGFQWYQEPQTSPETLIVGGP